ncbi:MAG: peptidoglycan bridge formation glycyltransferase FemA/FemB family protein, partial [Desulfobacterales bacterium]|nr:peptidoglycan bridge formation glycyltransferase FemA/FemB family protein [Desulfobacterales bacterium]
RIITSQHYRPDGSEDSYCFTDKHTHILDLTRSEEELWKNMEGRCRTAIRKANNSGVTVDEMSDRKGIEKYYAILQQVYRSQNKPCPNPKRLYYDIWDNYGRKRAVFLSARYNHSMIAGAIIIMDGKRAYYLNGVSKHEFRNLSASNLILWEAVRIARENGAERFDFVGSDIPRLAKFKKSFGGELSTHSCIEKACSRLFQAIRNNYPVYKNKIGNIQRFFENRIEKK